MKFNSPDPLGSNDAELDEEEFLYVGDVDEVLDLPDNDHDDIADPDSDTSDTEEPPDNAQLVFTEHSDAVFCGSIHPQGKICVTGGEDDKANIWNLETGEVLFTCDDHKDSVIIAAFSFDGAYLATADMCGLAKVRKCPNGSDNEWNVVWEFTAGDLSWGFWHTAAHVLICSATSGEVYIWKIPSGESKVLQSHGKQSLCGSLLRDGKRLAVGYDDGTVKIWDLKSALALHHIVPDITELSPVNAIDCFHDNNLIIAGHLDGRILMLKSAIGKRAGAMMVESTVESIKFSKEPSLSFVAIGTLNGSISVWDVARQCIRHQLVSDDDREASGVTSVFWIGSYLLAACLNGSVKAFEAKSGNLVKTFTGHKAEILDMAYSPVSDLLLTTSGDTTCRVFKVDLPKL